MQAYIGGIQAISTTFWPKNICMEISFAGCNFRCPVCNSSDFLDFKNEFLMDLKDIKNRIKESGCDLAIFTGGEPLLQRQALLELMRFCKSRKIKTVLQTNASRPLVINNLLEESLVDSLIIDIKAPHSERFQTVTRAGTFFEPHTKIMESIEKSLKFVRKHDKNVDVILKTIIIPNLMYKKEDLLEIASLIQDINAVWYIQAFSNENVLEKKFRKINSPSEEFLQTLRSFIIKEFPHLRIECDYSV